MSEDTPTISTDDMAALLGRPLRDVEEKNYNLYLEIAIERLDDLLCLKIKEMEDIPADLKLLIARAFAVILQEQEATATHGINRKQVEDFSISYFEDSSSSMVEFVRQNEALINKYSACQASIRSGKVICGDCFRCI